MGQFIAPIATTIQRLTITPAVGELIFDTTSNMFYGGNGSTVGGFAVGNGDVYGPSSAVNNRVAFFDGTTGKLIKDSGLTLSGTNTGDQTITLTGDVTGSGTGSFAATISSGSVTLAKMASLAANSIIGNNTGVSSTPLALTGTQVTAMLDLFTSTTKGLAPLSGGGTTNFLRADGTWAAPPNSGGTVTSVAALTLGTSGTDLSSSVANGTTTPVITLNVPDASATNRGALTSTDWSTFNGKQAALSGSGIVKSTGGTISYLTDNSTNWDSAYTNRITSLTTTGSSGAATLVSNTLNIPNYTLSGLGGQPLATNLTSLAGLSYSSASFVKMTAAGTFSLDTDTYLTGNQTITLSGDISGSGSTAITTTIGANKVANSMLAQVSTAIFKGRTTAGTGDVEDLTATQATALLDTFTSSLKGLTPASGGGTTNFLRADGTWAAPGGGGGGTPGGSDTQIQYNNSGAFAGSANLIWDNTNTRLGIAQSTPTSRFHLNFNQNSVTQSDANGILLANSTAATVGVQSISPAIVLQGNGWKTNATAGSQDVRFRMDVLPVQGTANPTATWRLLSNINNAGYSNALSYTSNGILSLNNVISVAGGTGLINASSQIISGATSTSTLQYYTTNGGSALTPVLYSGAITTNTAGTLSISYDSTNQLSFNAANGAKHISRAAIQITNLTNTAGAETGDLAFYTKASGAAMAEAMRIFAGGNVSIGGTSNSGYKLDVAGQTRLQFDVTISDTRNFIFSTSTGSKFGTATGQKIAFWNKTPIAQPTTATTAAAFVANTSLIANDTATFGGYTIGQVVAALINVGILA